MLVIMSTVGIIVPTKKRFDEWVKLFGLEEERYVHLSSIDKTIGQVFSKVLKSKDWYLIKDADKILEYANYRTK